MICEKIAKPIRLPLCKIVKIQKTRQITSGQMAESIYWMSDYQWWKYVKSENFGRLPEGKWVKISQKKPNLGGGGGAPV